MRYALNVGIGAFIFSILGQTFAQNASSSSVSDRSQLPLSSFHTEAPQAILYDMQTDTVLFEKAADQVMVPSSMTKVLLVYMVFERLSKGQVALSDVFRISEKAWRMGGSKMFLNLNSDVKLQDLLQGVIVQSGNDACIALAEGLAGSEAHFAVLMNQKAKTLGAENTHFLNSTGWPERGHTSTSRDILLFGIRTIQDFPALYAQYYPQLEFTYNGIRQTNRNPLLYSGLGDGIKTGHTDEGGFGLLGSAKRGDRRIVFVINGLKNNRHRALAAQGIVKFGLDHFEVVSLYPANADVHQQNFPQGASSLVTMMTQNPVAVTVKRGEAEAVTKRVEISSTLKLPIMKGRKVGNLIVSAPGFADKIFPLFARESVESLNFFQKMWLMIKKAVWAVIG